MHCLENKSCRRFTNFNVMKMVKLIKGVSSSTINHNTTIFSLNEAGKNTPHPTQFLSITVPISAAFVCVSQSHNINRRSDRKMFVPGHDAAHAMQLHTIKDDRTLLGNGRTLEAQNLYLSPGPHYPDRYDPSQTV